MCVAAVAIGQLVTLSADAAIRVEVPSVNLHWVLGGDLTSVGLHAQLPHQGGPKFRECSRCNAVIKRRC